MPNDEWKDEVARHFDNVRIIERCQAETLEHFDQFCEFIAEPAFEALEEEMKGRGVRVRYEKRKGRSVRIAFDFPRAKADQFHYLVCLPANAVELKLKLEIRGRKAPRAALSSAEHDFMPGMEPVEVMRMSKETLLLDILERYRNFVYAAMTSPD